VLDASGRVALIARGAEIASAQLARASNGMGGMPGAMLTLSANNGEAGLVWATAPIDGDANMEPCPESSAPTMPPASIRRQAAGP